MRVDRDIAHCVVAVRVARVGAQTAPLAADGREAARHISVALAIVGAREVASWARQSRRAGCASGSTTQRA